MFVRVFSPLAPVARQLASRSAVRSLSTTNKRYGSAEVSFIAVSRPGRLRLLRVRTTTMAPKQHAGFGDMNSYVRKDCVDYPCSTWPDKAYNFRRAFVPFILKCCRVI